MAGAGGIGNVGKKGNIDNANTEGLDSISGVIRSRSVKNNNPVEKKENPGNNNDALVEEMISEKSQAKLNVLIRKENFIQSSGSDKFSNEFVNLPENKQKTT